MKLPIPPRRQPKPPTSELYLYGSIRADAQHRAQYGGRTSVYYRPPEPLLDRPSLGQPDRDLEERELASQIREAALALLSRQERRVILYVRIRGMTNAATGYSWVSVREPSGVPRPSHAETRTCTGPYLSQDVR